MRIRKRGSVPDEIEHFDLQLEIVDVRVDETNRLVSVLSRKLLVSWCHCY